MASEVDWQIQFIFAQRSQYCAWFLCTRKAVCVHVMCAVITVHAICKGLMKTIPISMKIVVSYAMKLGIRLEFGRKSVEAETAT